MGCAVITGASGGIGSAIAKALAAKGYPVVLNYCGNAERAEALLTEIEASGGAGMTAKADVSKADEVQAMMEAGAKTYDGISVLVNNAGITRDGLFLRMKEQDFDRVIQINLKGAFLCAKHVVSYMVKAKYGRIVNISSVVGEIGNAGQANYASAKAGLLGMTKSLAKELASRNITVNAVAPGFIETEMTAVLNDKIREEMLKGIPTGRFGQPEDVAAAVAFLTDQQAAYITGQVLNVDGGMVM